MVDIAHLKASLPSKRVLKFEYHTIVRLIWFFQDAQPQKRFCLFSKLHFVGATLCTTYVSRPKSRRKTNSYRFCPVIFLFLWHNDSQKYYPSSWRTIKTFKIRIQGWITRLSACGQPYMHLLCHRCGEPMRRWPNFGDTRQNRTYYDFYINKFIKNQPIRFTL